MTSSPLGRACTPAALFLTLLGLTATAVGQGPASDRPAALKELARPYFPVGVGVDVAIADRPGDWPLLTTQFDFVTPENCMKPQAVRPTPDAPRLDACDRYVDFATEHGMKVCGHCLVWAKDDRTPPWFFEDGEQEATKDVLLARMTDYITTLVSRYKGRIAMWDVVNEALADGEGDDLRPSGWTRIAGDEFLAKAFEAAHAADPDALLIYNDYGCETSSVKREKLLRLAKTFKDRGVPCHAIGLQGHYELDDVPADGVDRLIGSLRELGFRVVVSELDIDVVKRGRWWAEDGKYRAELSTFDPYQGGCPPEILARQAEQYAALFSVFAKHREGIARVSFWNLHDGQSWLNDFPWTRTNHPLLFDRAGQPKPAFAAVADVLTAAGGK